MNIEAIPVGPNAPWDINVIIEIPQGGLPVKYEMDKESGALFVDRFLHTAMYYPGNYGFVPHTLSDDGDPCDVIVLNPTPVVPGCVIRSRPIGVLKMVDEAGGDEKILAVPVDKLNPYYTEVSSYRQLPAILIEQIALLHPLQGSGEGQVGHGQRLGRRWRSRRTDRRRYGRPPGQAGQGRRRSRLIRFRF